MSNSTSPAGLNDVSASEWSDINPRLARMAAALRAGARLDRFCVLLELGPALSETELSEIETQTGTRLPGQYRSFLLQAGNGGAGPHYGLCSLRKTDGTWEVDGDQGIETDMDRLAEPFRHTTAFYPPEFLPVEPTKTDFKTPGDYYDAADKWDQRRWQVVDEHTCGLLYLCEIGCGLRIALVVTGPARGGIWINRIAEGAGIEPLFDSDGAPLTFTAWYREWLDDMEETLRLPRWAET